MTTPYEYAKAHRGEVIDWADFFAETTKQWGPIEIAGLVRQGSWVSLTLQNGDGLVGRLIDHRQAYGGDMIALVLEQEGLSGSTYKIVPWCAIAWLEER